jgi:sensor histidine kinase YesM
MADFRDSAMSRASHAPSRFQGKNSNRYNGCVPQITPQRRTPSFWPLQIGGWTLYGLATAVSYIPFRHMREQVDYQVALLCSTFVASFVLYACCHFLWRRSTALASALFLSVAFSYILGVLCTVVSALTALHLVEPRTPLSWSLVVAQAFESAIILIAWSALYFGIKHYGTVEEQRERLLKSEATAREAQLQALRYQLQPHFLFNTLNAVSSLVVSKQPERATEMIAKLAALLRNTLSFPEAHVVTLREELAVTEEYLSIEQVRFGPRLAISLSVSADAYEAQVPRFLLQPIVENAIRHGIARCPNGGEVAIRASANEGRLRIDIENDHTEVLPQSGDEGNGLGLANTKTRLEKLYGEQGSITATTAQNSRFLVSIQFPLTTASSTISQGAGQ